MEGVGGGEAHPISSKRPRKKPGNQSSDIKKTNIGSLVQLQDQKSDASKYFYGPHWKWARLAIENKDADLTILLYYLGKDFKSMSFKFKT